MDKFLWFAIMLGSSYRLWFVSGKINPEKAPEIPHAGNRQSDSKGAGAYLNKQYKTIGIIAAVLFVIGFIPKLGWTMAFGF